MALHGIAEDVVFDHEGAARLAAAFRATATVVSEQSGARPGLARTAAVHFQGAYADDFAARTAQGVRDGHELAAALRRAAGGLEEMSAAATREQARRVAARAWQAQQEDRDLAERIGDNVHDFFAGEDDVPPPSAPEPPYRFLSTSCVGPR